MRKGTLAAIAGVFVAGGVVAVLVWNDSRPSPNVRPETAAEQPSDPVDQTEAGPARAADLKMRELQSPAERIAHLDWVAGQDWARSDSAVLRTTIVSDPDEGVQLHAVETALKLAEAEKSGSAAGVVRTALASSKGNTRARGLKAATDAPDPELVPTLIELVNNGDEYATMALNALAHTDSKEAHAKVLALAEDETANPKLRQRAVALLAVTKDPEAYTVLVELSNGEDQTLQRIANNVLEVLNEE